MIKIKNRAQNIWVLTPLFGILAFVCLYIVATFFYPGGSQVHKSSKGFSWTQNYWCNLLNENAINGEHNSAKPLAMIAMFILCLTIVNFWYIFPVRTGLPKKSRLLIQVSGVLSMTIGMFLFTDFHDMVINVASFFGMIATIGIILGLRKLKWKNLFWLGNFNLVLVVLNNVLYYGEGLKLYLPVLQKITFLFFLLWIFLVDIHLFNKTNSKLKAEVR